jgi:DNA-binding transcriptional LysR family regulator
MKAMRQTNLSAIDLNLLVALDALLREGSVSRAARAVGLSQPAMSRTLGRLRDLFDDPLLVRAGHAMVPTARARELAEPLARSLEAIRRTLDPPGRFDPSTALRSFVVGAVDTTQAVVLPRLLEAIEVEAPGIDVSTAPLRSAEETFVQLASGERDLAIGRFEALPDGIRRALLYADRLVCLVREGHPRIRGRLTMKRYLAESHLSVESAAPVERPFTIEGLLAERGLSRRVVCRVDNLAMAPFVVARTDLVASAPERTVAPFARGLGLRVLAPPFAAPTFELHLAWHARADRDEGSAWLRERMLALFAEERNP